MAIKQLTEEQVRTWTPEQKDRWWREHVFRGDMPQLTIRSGLFGMCIGGLLSLTNLYVGMKTGWTLGVGITSVILAFTFFKVAEAVGLADEFTILENNAMQSIATAAGYMTSPLIASLAAYMMITGEVIPALVTLVWCVAISLLGVLFAFPLKRRFVNYEQHPFPEGRAAGVVMDALHTSDAGAGFFKGKILVIVGVVSAALEFFKQADLLEQIGLKFMAIPHALEAWFYKVLNIKPAIAGTPLPELTVSLDPDHVMMCAGGLMGIRTGVSILIGALVNYCILAPWAIQRGDVLGVVGDAGTLSFGFRAITTWALWGGVAMMTTASVFAFFSKPKMILGAFAGLLGGKRDTARDVLKDVELPMSVFVIGIPIVGAVVVGLAYRFFDVAIWLGVIAIPMVFVFSIIGAHSTALTSITPTGALGKLTQLSYAALTPSIKTNIITASITGEVAGNSSNLLMDIKPGYMLGGKPRHQAMGHVLGIIAGAVASVPVFYFAFLKNNPAGLVSEKWPMPAALIWKGVAEILTRGLSELPTSAIYAAAIGAVLGVVFELIKLATKGRFPLSAVGMGLAFVIPFTTCFAMFLGAFLFWLAERLFRRERTFMKRVFVDNLEPVCAGGIAGGALMGIGLAIYEVLRG